jgi:hypothetical protein
LIFFNRNNTLGLYEKNPPGGFMRKLVFILIAFIAAVTFIRAFDNGGGAVSGREEPKNPLARGSLWGSAEDSGLPAVMRGEIPGREINFDLDH